MKFIKTVKRPYLPLYMSLFYEGYNNASLWEKYMGFPFTIHDVLNVKGVWFYPDYHMIGLAKQLSNRIFKNKKLFTRLKKVSLQSEHQIIRASQKNYAAFCNAFRDYVITVGIYFILDDAIEQKIKKELRRKTTVDEVNTLMNFLLIPLQDNSTKREKLSLLKNPLQKHLKEFSWIHSRYGTLTKPSVPQIRKMKQELIKLKYLVTYKKEKAQIKAAIAKAKKLLRKDKFLIDIMQFFIYYRTQRTDILNKSIYRAHSIIEQEAKKRKMSYIDFLHCTNREITDNKIPSQQIINERKKQYVFIAKDNTYKVLIGADRKSFEDKYDTQDKRTSQIKGNIAYPGKVTGKVKVIHTPEDLSRVSTGDILVTSMTTPNMVPTLEKAAAFVTDEGGITCHASIIAREMKKPCIIGTKIATNVLKDGDKVLVDATHGVITILQ